MRIELKGENRVHVQIVIDGDLMNEAFRLTGLSDKSTVIAIALKELVAHRRHDSLNNAFGKMPWEGELDVMRLDRSGDTRA
jgi:Arc/MetJ family transcription regulator